MPDWRDLAHRTSADLAAAGLRLLLDHTARAIDPVAKQVTVTDPAGADRGLEQHPGAHAGDDPADQEQGGAGPVQADRQRDHVGGLVEQADAPPCQGVKWAGLLLSALVLFGVGAYSAVTLVGDWWRSGPGCW